MNCRVAKKILLTTFALLLFALGAEARDRLYYRGFSGGMMLHSGWVSAGDVAVGTLGQAMRGMPKGIGGALKVQLGEHFRVGTEGYTSTLSYGEYGSSLSLGWGGVLVDWMFEAKMFSPYFGATIGGGGVKNITLNDHPANDFIAEENLSYRKYSLPVVAPFVGVDYPLSERMSLTFKADYIMPLSVGSLPAATDFPSGVRLYFGFLFSH